ncbi:MAG: MBL fold metallo-hydrolase [Acidobacteriota bacterium]|jgi:phosphoribosyl 1,2-cyclic phosphodiesterase|nr:MBL fold metallo-hydrolase [Acidobacteriota bacterium]
MGLCFNVLGSGSRGNATIVSDGATHILVDAGLSGKETARRLGEFGLDPGKVSAIVITHEHPDHCMGVNPLVKKWGIPLYMTQRAFEEASGRKTPLIRIDAAMHRAISPGEGFAVGGIEVTCFSVPHYAGRPPHDAGRSPHDAGRSLRNPAVEPLGFVFEKDGVKIGIAIDLGFVTNLVAERLKGCAGLVLESNHDVRMLQAGPYPWEIKQYILSRGGHLSNDQAAHFLANEFDGAAAHVVLAHLSEKCNHPDIALTTAETALEERRGMAGMGCRTTKCAVARPDRIGETYRY